MNKYIERVEKYKEKTLQPALEKIKSEYETAEDFYSDTGYDRYFNKMKKCEKEMREIEEYLKKGEEEVKDISTDQYKEYLNLKKLLSSIKSNITYIMADLPDCTEKMRLHDCLMEIESQ